MLQSSFILRLYAPLAVINASAPSSFPFGLSASASSSPGGLPAARRGQEKDKLANRELVQHKVRGHRSADSMSNGKSRPTGQWLHTFRKKLASFYRKLSCEMGVWRIQIVPTTSLIILNHGEILSCKYPDFTGASSLNAFWIQPSFSGSLMLCIISPAAQAEFDLDKLSFCMSAASEMDPTRRQRDEGNRQRVCRIL